MASRTDDYTTRIFINDTQAKNKIEQLKKEADQLRGKMTKAADAGDWKQFASLKKQLQQNQKELNAMQTSAQKVNHVLGNLKTASLKEIRQTMGAINRELKSGNVKRNSEEWKFLNTQLRRCKEEIAGISAESKASQPVWKRLWNGLNTNWGALTQILGTVSGLTLTIRQCTKAYADMEEVMAGTRKYTGLADDAVREMNEDFKKMDTRTSREQLNEFAGAAGRLGKQSKKDIEEFVDAADKISVALGDDLGDKAVDQIGKLAMAFGEDKTKGLRGAMLATGSAVNELAQNSAASAGYLVDFTARLAGVGRQAGLTQAQIMAMGAVLDSNLQQDETSATALSQLITKMSQDPAKFAKIAGKSISEFTYLVKHDMNDALLQFFDAMNKKGGFTDLAPMLNDMSLDGTRAAGVLTVMAQKLGDIREMQDLANKSYNDGSSVLKEFEIQNSTVQAGVDKAKKEFNEMAITLGRQLLPVAQNAISAGSLGVKALSVIVGFITRNKTAIIELAKYVAGLVAIYNALWIKQKLVTAVTLAYHAVLKAGTVIAGVYKAAMTALQATLILVTRGYKGLLAYMRLTRLESLKNPYTALAAALLTVGVAVYEGIKKWKSYKKAQYEASYEAQRTKAVLQDLKDVQQKQRESVSDEARRVQQLSNIVHSSAYSYQERSAAIKALQKLVPDWHASLTRERKLHESNADAIRKQIEALNDLALAQALVDKMAKIQGDKFDAYQKLRHKRNNVRAVNAELERNRGRYEVQDTNNSTGYSYAPGNGRVYTAAGKRKLDELQIQTNALTKAQTAYNVQLAREKEINKYLREHPVVRKYYTQEVTGGGGDNTVTTNNTGNNGGGGATPTYASDKEQKKQETERKKREAAARKREREMRAAEKARYQEEIKTAKGATDQEQAENLIAYSQNKKLYSQYMDDRHDIAIRGYKALEAIYKKYGTDYGQWQDEIAKEQSSREEDHTKALLSDIELDRQKEALAAQKDYESPSSDIYHDEIALNERLFDIDMSAMADRLAALQEGSGEWLDTKAEMTRKEEEHEISLRKTYADLLLQYREQWGKKSAKEQEDIAVKGLDKLHEKGLVKETEYQEMLTAIRLHYAKERSEANLDNSLGEQTKRNGHTAYEAAHNNAVADYENNPDGNNVFDYLASDVTIYMKTIGNIKKMEETLGLTHEETMEAMGEATGNMCNGLAAKMQTAFEQVSSIMNGMSSYYSAVSDYEVTVTEKKYDTLIEKAGNNTARTKKLEEKKEKEVAKIKTKYARKQAAMQVAQAIAQTAISAIAAYGSAMSAVPYPANMVVAPIAAGIALAAGAIQIATIKKQQQAQEAGYYEGGFTGGSSYRREAGVVHEGEFVANHQTVNNPQLLPALRLIDLAQRNNTVGSLTAADVSRSMGVGGNTTVVSAPQVNVTTDNSELQDTLQMTRDVITRLGTQLEDGSIIVRLPGWDDIERDKKHWDNLKSNK